MQLSTTGNFDHLQLSDVNKSENHINLICREQKKPDFKVLNKTEFFLILIQRQ